MKYSEHDFLIWYKEHEEHLRYYTLKEICSVARACGFELGHICPNIQDWLMRSANKIKLWDSPLFEKWVRATLAQKGHDEIGE